MILKFSWKIPHLCTRAKLGAEDHWFPQAEQSKVSWSRPLLISSLVAHGDQWGKIINMSLGRGPEHLVNCTLVARIPVRL